MNKVAPVPDVVEALRVFVGELVREALAAHVTARTHYSQNDGERPPGYVGNGTPEGNRRARQSFLRVLRDHGEELGVVEHGKTRLVPSRRGRLGSPSAGRASSSVPASPPSGTRPVEDVVLEELGGRRAGRGAR